MGFWDTVGKAASAVGKEAMNTLKENSERIQQHKDSNADKSDSELFEALASATRRKQITEGGAIRTLLKARGYDNEEISAKIRSML